MRTGLEALKELKECIITLVQDYGTYGSNREKIYNKYCNEERKLIEVIEKDLLFVEILKKTFKFGVEEQKIGDTKLNWKIIAEKLTNEYDKQIRDFILKECFPKELKALEIIKENIIVSYDESENDKPCLILGIKVNKYNTIIFYETYDKEKIDLLKEVLL